MDKIMKSGPKVIEKSSTGNKILTAHKTEILKTNIFPA